MSRWTTESWPPKAAACSGVKPREPRAEPDGTEGEKNSEKILAPQKSKFWKLWPLKILPGLKEHCNIVGLRCFEAIELLKKKVAFGILLKPCC